MSKVLWAFITSIKPEQGNIEEYDFQKDTKTKIHYYLVNWQDKDNLYLFVDQQNLGEYRNNLKTLFDIVSQNKKLASIIDSGILNILFHDKQLGFNLSVTNNTRANPWNVILNDVDMLEKDPEQPNSIYAKTFFGNFEQKGGKYYYKYKIKDNNDKEIDKEVEIEYFYIFRHQEGGICNQFINDIANGNIDKSFPEDYIKKKEIINIKKGLIQLFLPIAIDIQGLNEVKENLRSSYIEDICNSSNESNPHYYKQVLVDFWNIILENKFGINKGKLEKIDGQKNENSLQEIIANSKLDFNTFFFSSEGKGIEEKKIDIGLKNINTINPDSPLVKFMIKMDEICNLSQEELATFCNDYILESKREFFFPDWVNKLSKKLDEIEKLLSKEIS